jgi:site-specific DNA-cytosine methylase
VETIELFCGTKSFSKVAKRRGFGTFTVDSNSAFEPDLVADIGKLSASRLRSRPFILWASPPCQAFSVAAISRYWNRDGTPKDARVFEAKKLVVRTLALIRAVEPEWWFIENPRGMLRKMPFMQKLARHTITYCQYGDTRQKPTDIWTNAQWWTPRPPCSPGAPCHEAAPRGSRGTGTQGMRDATERARIPSALFDELFDQAPCRLHRAA